MEFKINKIDTDIRTKFEEDNKHEKIHSGDDSASIKQLKDDKENTKKHKKNSNNRGKKYITVDCIRGNTLTVDAQIENVEIISEGSVKGRVLDTKK